MPKPPDKPSTPTMADTDIEQQAQYSPVLRHMIEHKLPLTRQTYVI